MGLLIIYLLTGWLPTLMRDAGFSIERAAFITGIFQIGGSIGSSRYRLSWTASIAGWRWSFRMRSARPAC